MHGPRKGSVCRPPTVWTSCRLVGCLLQYPRQRGCHHMNEFRDAFRAHYVPIGLIQLKKREFSDLRQGNMSVAEYVNKFTYLSRYAPEDVNTDGKKQFLFLKGLTNDLQFQLLNTDYESFQKLVDKALVIENKRNEMEREGKRKMVFQGQSSNSHPRPRFMPPPPQQSYRPPINARPPMYAPRPHLPMQRPNFQNPRPNLQA